MLCFWYRSPKKPAIPPYFGGNFFESIKIIKNVYDLEKVTLKEIYNVLAATKIKTNPLDIHDPPKYILLNCEQKNANLNWEKIWQNVRKKGLDPETVSFLLKMVWGILPTEKRLARLVNGNENCKFCLEKRNVIIEGNIEHFLISCPENCEIPQKLINEIMTISNLNASNLISFSFDITLINDFPIIWLLSNFLRILWNLKKTNRFSKEIFRSQLLSENNWLNKICPNLNFNRIQRLINDSFD